MSNVSSSTDRDELYKNWIKSGLGLIHVKNGVTKYVVDTVNNQHANILKSVLPVSCTSYKLKTLQPAHTCTLTKGAPELCPLGMDKCLCLKKNQIPCPNNFCGAIHDEIVKSHRYLGPTWSNTDISKWSTDSWEVAKCFINISGYADKMNADETDCSGILSIVCNNISFPPSLKNTALQVKTSRNNIMHAPYLELDSTSLEQYLTEMEDLLACIPPSFPEAKSAATNIQMLSKTYFITSKDETEMRIDALKDFRAEKDRLVQELQNKEKEISDLKDQSIAEITKTKEAATTNIQSEMSTCIKELHTELNLKKEATKKEMDESKENYTVEIESTANKALSQIDEMKADVLQSINDQTKPMKDSISELHEKHKDVEIKLEGLEKTLSDEKKTVKILSGRTEVVEEKQKLMEASIAKLNSKNTNLPNEISTMEKELENLDKKIHTLTSLADKDKEELRKDLCEYYRTKFSHVSITPGVSCPIGMVSDILLKTTEIKPAVDEEKGIIEIECKDVQMYENPFREVTQNENVLYNTYKCMFYRENQPLKSVLLVGKTNTGKTGWCLNLMQKWVNVSTHMRECEHCRDSGINYERDGVTDEKARSECLKDDELFLCKFDIAIYLPLKEVKDLSDCHTIVELMENCNSFQFYQDKEKLEKLERLLKSDHDQCLILFDDLHLLCESRDVLIMREIENSWKVSTTIQNDYEILEIEPNQFERFARIEFADKYEIQTRFAEQYAKTQNVQVTDIVNRKQIETFFETNIYLSGIPVLSIYMMSYWFKSKHIENTLASNYAAMLDFLISLAEESHSGNITRTDNPNDSNGQSSNPMKGFPECFGKFRNLKKHISPVLRYGHNVFNRMLGLEDFDISKNEQELLKTLGIIVFADAEELSLKTLTFSLDMFLAALYLCIQSQETKLDTLLAQFDKYVDEDTKLMDRREFMSFICCIDPKIESSLSFILYKKMIVFEEKFSVFDTDDLGGFAIFDIASSSVEYPIYTEKISLENDLALHMWKCNTDHVLHVSLDKETITEKDLVFLKQSKSVVAVTWQISDANMETYDLKLVSNELHLVQSLTVLILDGSTSGWIPNCTETQDIDLSKCRSIQHLYICNISCRQIAVNSDSLTTISICSIARCAITIMHYKHITDETDLKIGLDSFQCKLRHIRLEHLKNCKLDIFSGPKNIYSVVLRGCLLSNVLFRIPSTETEEASQISLSHPSEYISQDIEITDCKFTKLIYLSDMNQRDPLQCQNQYKENVSIKHLLYQKNIQSGISSKMSLKVSEVTLRYISDDSSIKRDETKQKESEPNINENIDIGGLPEVNNKTILLSLKQMQGLHSLTCEEFDSLCWEYLGMVLPELQDIRSFSVINEKDIPVSVIKSIKGIRRLNKFVIDGNWQGSETKPGITNKRQLALKEMGRILPKLDNIDACNIRNIHQWPKQSLQCLKNIPVLNSLQIQMKTVDEIETSCNILQSVQRLESLTVECLTEEDVSEIILFAQYIKDLEVLSYSGITFSDCFPEEHDSLDLSSIRSFRIDSLESQRDIPNIVRYLPKMAILHELTIHAFLSDESCTLLASCLPALPNLRKTDFIISLHTLLPVAVVESLAKNVNLRKVTLTFPYLSDHWPACCECISHLSEIDSLNLFFSAVNDELTEFSPLKRLAQLKEFSIFVHGYVKPKVFFDLEEVFLHLPHLEILELGSNVRCSFIVKALRHLVNLHSLYLPDFSKTEWIELGQVLPYLSKLRYLETAYRDPIATKSMLTRTGKGISRMYENFSRTVGIMQTTGYNFSN